MRKNDYFEKARNLYDEGQIDGATYDAMALNAGEFCDEDEPEGDDVGIIF